MVLYTNSIASFFWTLISLIWAPSQLNVFRWVTSYFTQQLGALNELNGWQVSEKDHLNPDLLLGGM